MVRQVRLKHQGSRFLASVKVLILAFLAGFCAASGAGAADLTLPSWALYRDLYFYQNSDAVSVTLPAATGGTPPLTYTLEKRGGGSLPAGLSFNASTRTLSGTPTTLQGRVVYTYKVTDSEDNMVRRTTHIHVVVPSFRIVGGTSHTVKEQAAFSRSMILDAKPGGTVTVTLTNSNPAKLTVTPTTFTFDQDTWAIAQHFTASAVKDDDGNDETVTITLTGSGGGYDSATGTITVTVQDPDPGPPVVANAIPDQTVAVNATRTVALASVFRDSDGDALMLSASSSSTGTATVSLSGTTLSIGGVAAGTATVTVTATDPGGLQATDSFTVTVTAPGTPPPVITPPPVVTPPPASQTPFLNRAPVVVNAISDQTVGVLGTGSVPLASVFIDPDGDALTLSASSSSTGTATVSLSGTTLSIGGVATGTATVTVTATDSGGLTATDSFDVTVTDTAPSFGDETIADMVIGQGVAMSAVVLPAASGGNGALRYSLSPALPAGVSFDADTRTLSGMPPEVQDAVTYTYTVADSDDNTSASDTASLTFSIRVDGVPSFGGATIADLNVTQGVAIEAMVLPVASGGNGALRYSLWPNLSAGLSYDADTRTLSGTPSEVRGAVTYTYTVADSDDNTSASDTASLTFSIGIDGVPSFGGATIADLNVTQGVAIEAMVLPAARGGNGVLRYSLSPALPTGVSYDAGTRTLSGTPSEMRGAVTYTYTVVDSDDNTSASDTASLTFSIGVDGVPSFGSATIADMILRQDVAMAPVVLPVASGGNGSLRYSLRPNLPAGLSFDARTRTLSGVPSGLRGVATYTYTVVDSDDNTGADDAASLTFSIGIDRVPSFGSATIADMVLEQGVAMASVVLPAARGGNGALHYSLSPALPAGVSFDAGTRRLSGVPSEVQDAVTYTYTVADADANTGADDAASLTFSIGVDGVPSFGDATIADLSLKQGVAMASVVLPAASGGNGALHYSLSPALPAGVSFDADTRRLSGTPSGGQNATTYTYTVVDSDDNTSASDAASLSFSIGVDGAPSFGDATIADMVLRQDVAMSAVVLPAASGGNGALRYSLSPALPAGVSFDASTRRLAGTPSGVQDAVTYTYAVADSDDNTGASDTASLTFSIGIDGVPSFGGATIADLSLTQGVAMSAVVLPAASGGNGTLRYSLRPNLPAGVSFNARTRRLSGTPSGMQDAVIYTYTVADADANTGADDTASLTFSIGVDGVPSFGDATIADLSLKQGVAMSAVVLPAASGGNGALHYSLSPALPAGVSFDADTRTLSGTPSSVQDAVTYTYTVVDSDDNTSASDTASLTFSIGVDGAPSFGGATIADLSLTQGVAMAALVLPSASGGNGALRYSLSPALPAGVSFDADTRTLSGTPSGVQDATTYTYTVADADANTGPEDEDSLTFNIAVLEPPFVSPQAWLARFGRTVAAQVLDGVSARLTAGRLGTQATFAGQALNLSRTGPYETVALAQMGDWFTGSPAYPTDKGAPLIRTLTLQDALLGTSFALNGTQDARGGSLAFWGRGAQSRFAGQEGTLAVDGKVNTGMLGMDYAHGGLLAGVMVSHSRADGGYGGEGSETLSSLLTAGTAYGSLDASQHIALWGAAGYGQGELTLTRQRGTSVTTDLDWRLASGGIRGSLAEPSDAGGGSVLAVVSDALWTRTTSDAVSDPDRDETLAGVSAAVTRLRLGLEGGQVMPLSQSGMLMPRLEVGVRHDGGDAETGLGLEVGGGASLTLNNGLSLDIAARTLLVHAQEGVQDRGFSMGLVFDPSPASSAGLSVLLRHDIGSSSSGGIDALFTPEPLGAGTRSAGTGRWLGEVAYGLSNFGGLITGSPYIGYGHIGGARDYSVGWRYVPSGLASDLSFGLRGTRRESAGAGADHAVGLEARARW